MSSSIKLGLLALVGSAAAIPHYGAHSKFHSKGGSGYAGPTGGWMGSNHTRPAPTDAASSSVVAVGEKTTTIDGTLTSTETIYSTVYMTRTKSHSASASANAAPSSVEAASAPGTGEACGPATVYVTATNRVTVTVPAGGVASSSSVVPSSVAPTTEDDTSTQYIYVSPSPVGESSSSSATAEAVVKTTPSATSETIVKTTPPATSNTVVSSSAATTPVAVSSSSTSASASASSSSTPGYKGGKRGLAYRYDGAADAKSFAGKNAHWAFNWESDSRGDIGGTTYIPMLRSLDRAGNWLVNAEAAIKAGAKMVFALNEPDMEGDTNLSPSAACDAWIQYINPLAAKYPDVTFAAPAVSSTDASGKGLDWLAQFKTACPKAVYHAINIHWYGPSSAGVTAFKAHVDKATSQFGLPAFVTEFGLYPGESASAAESFLKDALTYLDGNDKCSGYAYYAVGNFVADANLLGNANSLTGTGKIYVA